MRKLVYERVLDKLFLIILFAKILMSVLIVQVKVANHAILIVMPYQKVLAQKVKMASETSFAPLDWKA